MRGCCAQNGRVSQQALDRAPPSKCTVNPLKGRTTTAETKGERLSRDKMALATEYIVVIVLASILLLLLLVFAVAVCIFTKRRRLLCFKTDQAARPFLVTDQQLEARFQGKRNQRDSAFSHKRKSKPAARKKKKSKGNKREFRYEPLQSPRKKDPFADGSLGNPLIDEEEFDEDWSNPAFDAERARLYDSSVVIQTWFRMVR